MSVETPICAACRFCRRFPHSNPLLWQCLHPKAQRRDLVSGTMRAPDCAVERGSTTGCGCDARNYEPAQEETST